MPFRESEQILDGFRIITYINRETAFNHYFRQLFFKTIIKISGKGEYSQIKVMLMHYFIILNKNDYLLYGY